MLLFAPANIAESRAAREALSREPHRGCESPACSTRSSTARSKGDYAELDDESRYHLRMMFDRSGRTDLGATDPVRMMQRHAGANHAGGIVAPFQVDRPFANRS